MTKEWGGSLRVHMDRIVFHMLVVVTAALGCCIWTTNLLAADKPPASTAEYKALDARSKYWRWQWMEEGETEEARHWREQYLSILQNTRDNAVREDILSRFTGFGDLCFDRAKKGTPDWISQLCDRQRVVVPQVVSDRLQKGRFNLNEHTRFRQTALGLRDTPRNDGKKKLAALFKQIAWQVSPSMQAQAIQSIKPTEDIYKIEVWHHPAHSQALIVVNGIETKRFIVDRNKIASFDIPMRFLYRYFNGGAPVRELVAVSDLDRDGALELWFSDTDDVCHDNEDDLKRGYDCRGKSFEMGELDGNVLSYFKPSPAHKQLLNPVSVSLSFKHFSDLRQAPVQCNRLLLGAFMAEKLDIDFGAVGLYNRGALQSLKCTPHPDRPNKLIVTLFSRAEQSSVSEDDVFIIATVDLKKRTIDSMYQEKIRQDVNIRIDNFDGALTVEKNAYPVIPDKTVVGVHWNIGHSHRCDNAGENGFFNLYVEEGRRWRPVLRKYPLSLWKTIKGDHMCGFSTEAKYTSRGTERKLVVSDESTYGWKNLDVMVRETTDFNDFAKDKARTLARENFREGSFRYDGKRYRFRASAGEVEISVPHAVE